MDITIPADPPAEIIKPEEPKPKHERKDGAILAGSRDGVATRAEIPKGTTITAVKVFSNPWVIGIELTASDGTTVLFGNDETHADANKTQTINFQGDEHLEGFAVWYNYEIDSIAVVTNKKTYGTVGSDANGWRQRKSKEGTLGANNQHIVGLYGKQANVLNPIGVIVEN